LVLLFSESQIKTGCYRFGPAHSRIFNNGCAVLLACMYVGGAQCCLCVCASNGALKIPQEFRSLICTFLIGFVDWRLWVYAEKLMIMLALIWAEMGRLGRLGRKPCEGDHSTIKNLPMKRNILWKPGFFHEILNLLSRAT